MLGSDPQVGHRPVHVSTQTMLGNGATNRRRTGDTLGFLLLLISSKESLYHPANMGHGFLVKRGTFSLDLITNSSN